MKSGRNTTKRKDSGLQTGGDSRSSDALIFFSLPPSDESMASWRPNKFIFFVIQFNAFHFILFFTISYWEKSARNLFVKMAIWISIERYQVID
jgi:hypothetical protein